jgi:hypothetical protein
MLSSYDERRVNEEATELEVNFRKDEIRHKLALEHEFRMRMIEIEFQQRKLRYLLELRDGLSTQIASIDSLIDSIKGG